MMYSDVHKQWPKGDDFFDGAPRFYKQSDVSLTSVSDLETNVKGKGRVKKNITKLPGLYLEFMSIFYTYITI